MESKDDWILELQFKNKIFEKNGTEFQNFCVALLQKIHGSDFSKINDGGGDDGNDGYLSSHGIYYQIYAPTYYHCTATNATTKLKNDFEKLKTSKWPDGSPIKEYNFIYNDKLLGDLQSLLVSHASLQKENPDIIINIISSFQLIENFLKQLSHQQLISLGFQTDLSQASKVIKSQLEIVQNYVFDDKITTGSNLLNLVPMNIINQASTDLKIEYEILKARIAYKEEDIDTAINSIKKLTVSYPNKIDSYLFLANIYLTIRNIDKYSEKINKAKEINSAHWRVKYTSLRYDLLYSPESINYDNVISSIESYSDKVKSEFYVLLHELARNRQDTSIATTYLDHATTLNPNRFINYYLKIQQQLLDLIKNSSNQINPTDNLSKIFMEIEALEENFPELTKRNKLLLYYIKALFFNFTSNIDGTLEISDKIIYLIYDCYCDNQIIQILSCILPFIKLNDINELSKLTNYLIKSSVSLNEGILNLVFLQFCHHDKLSTLGKTFFQGLESTKYIKFISLLEQEKYSEFANLIQNMPQFSYALSTHNVIPLDLRKVLIDNLELQDNNFYQKHALCLYYYDSKDLDKAYSEIKNIEISNINFGNHITLLNIVRAKQAFDLEIIILDALIENLSSHIDNLFSLKLQKFNALVKLEDIFGTESLGLELINMHKNVVDNITDYEFILGCTISAIWAQQKYSYSLEILENFIPDTPSGNFIIHICAKVYLKNNLPEKALEALVNGIYEKQIINPEELSNIYTGLYIPLSKYIQIEPSLGMVQEDTYIKFENCQDWRYIGNGKESLDATKISQFDPRYQKILGLKLGDHIQLNPYNAKQNHKIELIYTHKQYILYRIPQQFQLLTSANKLSNVFEIQFEFKDNNIDISPLLEILQSQQNTINGIFEQYRQNIYFPLALLASKTNGFLNVIEKIKLENSGYYIKHCLPETYNNQTLTAQEVVTTQKPFFIDTTSAFFLILGNMLEPLLNNQLLLYIPNSVIRFLHKFLEDISNAGEKSCISCTAGELLITHFDQTPSELIRRFQDNLNCLKQHPARIINLSNANKSDAWIEKEIEPSLSDACILAQQNITNYVVLTEDPLYIICNSYLTQKPSPKFCSSIDIVQILYEKNIIKTSEFLEYFNLLVTYKFKSLAITVPIIYQVLFQENNQLNINNLPKLHLSLLLSKSYGCTVEILTKMLASFLFYLGERQGVKNCTLIFSELINNLPTDYNVTPKVIMESVLKHMEISIDQHELNNTIKRQSLESINQFRSLLI